MCELQRWQNIKPHTKKSKHTKKEPERCESWRPGNDHANVTMSVGKVRLTEEIITDWRQKKKKGERKRIREGKEKDRNGREKMLISIY